MDADTEIDAKLTEEEMNETLKALPRIIRELSTDREGQESKKVTGA